MEVILNDKQQPQGVFLPLSEWEILKHGINKASELYKLMNELSQKDVFDMDVDEFALHVTPVAEKAAKQALDQGLYISYPAGPEGPSNSFIHEYKDGKRILIRIDTSTGKEHFIKSL